MAGVDHFQGPGIVLDDGTTSLPNLDQMFLGEPSEKGLSRSRKWGVKAHIERDNPDHGARDPNTPHPFNWESAYRDEQLRIEELSRNTAQ